MFRISHGTAPKYLRDSYPWSVINMTNIWEYGVVPRAGDTSM